MKKTLVVAEHKVYLDAAIAEAKKATCERRFCGSVVVADKEVIGRGSNTPSGNSEKQRRCGCDKDAYHCKVTDKTCCMHAEQRAIMDALKNNPEKLEGSTLYFVAVDESGEVLYAGEPYCTVCSKIVLDVGVKYFVLWHAEDKLVAYDTAYYNQLSYRFEG